MPGSTNAIRGHSWLSPFKTYRTDVTDADGLDPSTVQNEIDLSDSISAGENRIFLILRRESGTGEASPVLYMNLDTAQIPEWIKARDVQASAGLELIEIRDLYAARYKVVLKREDENSVWTIYQSVSNNNRTKFKI